MPNPTQGVPPQGDTYGLRGIKNPRFTRKTKPRAWLRHTPYCVWFPYPTRWEDTVATTAPPPLPAVIPAQAGILFDLRQYLEKQSIAQTPPRFPPARE